MGFGFGFEEYIGLRKQKVREGSHSPRALHRQQCDLSSVCLPAPVFHYPILTRKPLFRILFSRDTLLPRFETFIRTPPPESVPLCLPRKLLSNPISQTKWQYVSISWSVKWGWHYLPFLPSGLLWEANDITDAEALCNREVLTTWDVVRITNWSADWIQLDATWKDRPDTISSL